MTESEYLAHLARLRSERWPPQMRRDPFFPHGEVPLGEYLRRWAEVQPEKPAIIFYGRIFTYRDLHDLSGRCASLFAGLGVKAGDRVAIYMPNCPQFTIAFLAIMRLGAVFVPVNPLFRSHELIYELDDTEAEIVLVLDQLAASLEAVKAETRIRTVLVTSYADVVPQSPDFAPPPIALAPRVAVAGAIDFWPALAAVTEPPPETAVDIHALAALNYTGGTTGLPKGCMHTQFDMLFTAAANTPVGFRDGRDTVLLSFFPQFWIAGEDFALVFPFVWGGVSVLLARWDPTAYLEAVHRYRATYSPLVVDNVEELLEHPRIAEYDLRSLDHVRASSFIKKLSVAHRRRWLELTGTTLMENGYGMTETHTCDSTTAGAQENDKDILTRPIFVGLPFGGGAFKICDFETGELKPLGEEGEILVSRPSLLKGYWRRPKETAEAFRGAWFRSGDIGLIDEEGYLHFLGRRKEMLKVRGMSVFPAEIEALLGKNPAILGSAVLGRPDERLGEAPVAFIVLRADMRDGIDAQALSSWCREHMASYKVPEIRIIKEFPLTTTGKIKKEELRLRLADPA